MNNIHTTEALEVANPTLNIIPGAISTDTNMQNTIKQTPEIAASARVEAKRPTPISTEQSTVDVYEQEILSPEELAERLDIDPEALDLLAVSTDGFVVSAAVEHSTTYWMRDLRAFAAAIRNDQTFSQKEQSL